MWEAVKLISPLIAILGSGAIILLLGAFQIKQKILYPLISLVGVLLSWLATIWVWDQGGFILERGLLIDNFGFLVGFLITFSIFLVVLMSQGYAHRMGYDNAEYYGLIHLAGGGMMVMAMSTHLVTLFVALETLSIGVYALAGMAPWDKRSREGAIKYFILGSFASAILVYGIALLYGATSSFDIAAPAYAISEKDPLFITGLLLVTVGIAFKVGAIPFHWWVPDTYEGAPTPITGFMSTAVKISAFAFGIRILVHLFRLDWIGEVWMPLIWGMAVMTMIGGSVIALLQKNIKRLIAYSSIVHAGYLLIAVYVAGEATGEAAELSAASLLFYLAVYTFITLGTIGVIVALSYRHSDRELIESYRGLSQRSPMLALALTVFLLALAGIPPTAGFMGKFYIFKGAIQGGSYWLGALGIIASLISLYYYLRIVVLMYMTEPEEDFKQDFEPWGAKCALAICLALTFILGILPGAYFELSYRSVLAFFGP